MPFDERTFRNISGRFATGVTVVTSMSEGEKHGMTVNSFCSVSLDPMLVLFCAVTDTRTFKMIDQSGIFAVNILSKAQQDVSDLFAGKHDPEVERFKDIDHHQEATGAPIINGGLGYLDCRVIEQYPGGDHTIILGQVEKGEEFEGEPLLFYRGRYVDIAES